MYNSLGTKTYRTGRSLGIKTNNIARSLGVKMNPIAHIGNSIGNRVMDIGSHAILNQFAPTNLRQKKDSINHKNNLLK